MKKRMFWVMCLLTLISLVLTTALVFGVLSAKEYRSEQARVRSEAVLLAAGVKTGGEAFLEKASASMSITERFTLIAADGTMRYDSRTNGGTMKNLDRQPEVAAVLEGAAYGEREVQTKEVRTFYYAIPLDSNQILRLAAEIQTEEDKPGILVLWIVCLAVGLLLLTAVIERRMAASIIEPLVHLDLGHPMDTNTYVELTPLLSHIARRNRSYAKRMQELSARQEEFRALSEHMNEGLLLIDNNAIIMSINHSALRLLGGDVREDYIGRHVLQLTRVYELQKLMEQVLNGASAAQILPFSGKQYQVFANTVHVNGEQSGGLLLFLDVTEQQQAEQMRREFTANVSHELKTPLTSISGYAEMLASGMVRQEDIQEFSGRIYKEAQRLLALIDDIIKLSGLDENRMNIHRETVDLFALAQQTANSLELQAQERQVHILVEGEPVTIQAVPTMVGELVFNLTENAVKYNRRGGTVTIGVHVTDQEAVLRVQDTGIGIALQDQEHVFERFYRVDKSRSKETGGTGLGLSIVKHIAQLHGARIDLQSKEGDGTCIQVFFPFEKSS